MFSVFINKNGAFGGKPYSLSGSPRRENKIREQYLYNIHQMEYDYSIISKDANHMPNLKKPLRILSKNPIKYKKNIPNLNMYIKNPYARYKSTGKRISDLKTKKNISNSVVKSDQISQ